MKKEAVSSEIDPLVVPQSPSIPSTHTASDMACSRKKQPHRRPGSGSSATRETGSPRLDTSSGSSTSAHSTSISNNTPQLEESTTGNLDLIPVEFMPYFKELAAERTKLVGRFECFFAHPAFIAEPTDRYGVGTHEALASGGFRGAAESLRLGADQEGHDGASAQGAYHPSYRRYQSLVERNI